MNNIERLTEAYKQRYLRKKGNQPVRAYNSKRNADNKVNQPIPLRIVDEIVVTFKWYSDNIFMLNLYFITIFIFIQY